MQVTWAPKAEVQPGRAVLVVPYISVSSSLTPPPLFARTLNPFLVLRATCMSKSVSVPGSSQGGTGSLGRDGIWKQNPTAKLGGWSCPVGAELL